MKKVFEDIVIKAQVNGCEIGRFATDVLPQAAFLRRHTAGRSVDPYCQGILLQVGN